MDGYKPNSHRFKEGQKDSGLAERRKLAKVVSGTPRTKKKSGMSKLTEVFVSEDVSNVKSYIIMDVLLPALKNTIWDIVTGSLDMTLFEGKGRNGKRASGDKISYRGFYEQRNGHHSSDSSRPTTRTRFDYDDIVFDTRGEAEVVLRLMDETIEEYGSVTVADMYDMAGLTEPYTANKYGWTTVRSAEIKRVRDGGYIICLPKAHPLTQ